MRVIIKDTCQGCGPCEGEAPGVFQVQDDGTARVLVERVPEQLEQAVRDAAYACPTESIGLIDD